MDDNTQKRRILQTSAQLFARNGYDATGVAELGTAVGMGRGALYHHIKSKEMLLYEISMAHVVYMVDFGHELLAQDLPADEKFRTLARRLMSMIAENLAEVTVFFADARALTGAHRHDVAAKRAEFETIWSELLRQGAEEGIFRPVDPLVAKGILGMFNYSYLWLRANGESPEAIADLFIALVLSGLKVVDASAGA